MPKYELSLRDYLRILHRRKSVVIFTLFLFLGFAGYYASTKPPAYEAETKVRIEERKTIAGLLTEWIVYNPGNIMETQSKIIKGFPVVRKVALELGLVTEKTPLAKVHEVAAMLNSRIDTEIVGNTNIIKITASGSRPEEVLRLAEAVTNAYIEENLLEKNKQARTARNFIEEQLNSLENSLTARFI